MKQLLLIVLFVIVSLTVKAQISSFDFDDPFDFFDQQLCFKHDVVIKTDTTITFVTKTFESNSMFNARIITNTKLYSGIITKEQNIDSIKQTIYEAKLQFIEGKPKLKKNKLEFIPDSANQKKELFTIKYNDEKMPVKLRNKKDGTIWVKSECERPILMR